MEFLISALEEGPWNGHVGGRTWTLSYVKILILLFTQTVLESSMNTKTDSEFSSPRLVWKYREIRKAAVCKLTSLSSNIYCEIPTVRDLWNVCAYYL
jgi:hypothetical protein